jgi:hypothetical protein
MTAASWVARPLPAASSYVVWPAAREVHRTSNAEEAAHRRDSSGGREWATQSPHRGRGPNGRPSTRRHGLDTWSLPHESGAKMWRGAKVWRDGAKVGRGAKTGRSVAKMGRGAKVGRSGAKVGRRPFLPTPVLRISASPRDQRESQ